MFVKRLPKIATRKQLAIGSAMLMILAAVAAVITWSGQPSGEQVEARAQQAPTPQRNDFPPIEQLIYSEANEVTTLDPAVAYDFIGYRVASAVCAGLMRLDANGNPTPDLAKDVEIVESENGSVVYRFTLKGGLTFHDGSPLRAEDVKYSIERMLQPDLNSPGASFFSSIVGYDSFREGGGDLAGVVVEDGGSIIITTSPARNSFLYAMALNFGSCVMPESWTGDAAYAPVSAGPYRISERTDDTVILKRFEGYPESSEYPVEQVVIAANVDQHIGAERFVEREVDIIGPFAPADMTSLLAQNEGLGSATYSFDWPLLIYLTMNTQQPPLDDVRLRRAVNHAIDRDRLAEFFGDVVVPVDQILPPQMPGHDPDYKGLEYNPELARQLVREAVGQETVTLDLYHFDSVADYPVVDELERQLGESGIELRSIAASGSELTRRAGDPDTQGMSLAVWSADFLDASNFFYPLLSATSNEPGTWNFAHYENPAVEELAVAAERLIGPQNEAERLEKWRELYALAMDDAPWVPLFSRPIQILADEDIHPLISDKGMKNLLEFRVIRDGD